MGYKGYWDKAKESDLYELTRLAKKAYPKLKGLPEEYIKDIFKRYINTTCVFIQKTEIKGFAVYQEWPDALNFVFLYLPFDKKHNYKTIINGRKILPKKKIVWWDEDKMKARCI